MSRCVGDWMQVRVCRSGCVGGEGGGLRMRSLVSRANLGLAETGQAGADKVDTVLAGWQDSGSRLVADRASLPTEPARDQSS